MKLDPDLVALTELYHKPIINGRDPKGEIKALLAKMTGQDITRVCTNMSFGIFLLFFIAVIVAIAGFYIFLHAFFTNGEGYIISFILLAIGVGGILLIALV